MQNWITAVGILAGMLTAGSWIPQVVKTWRTGKAGDFSWGYLGTFTLGVATWEIYGLLMRDLAVIVANLVTIVFMLVVIAVKFRDDRMRRTKS